MKREFDAYKALSQEKISTYARAEKAHKITGVLHNADVLRLHSYNKQAKIERVNQSEMPYKMRLAAIQAVSNSTAKEKVW